MSKVTIRGHEFELGVFDLDETKRRADADAELGEKIQATDLINNPTYEGMVMVYEELDRFFGSVLGEGSLGLVLGGKRDVGDALYAYYNLRDALLDASLARATEITKRQKLPAKYRMDRVKK